MKILIVSHEYPPVGGGGANACLHLAKEYSKAGHLVDIVTVWFEGQKEFEQQDKIRIYRLKAKRKHLEHCGFPEMLDYLVKAKPVVNKLAKENDYDICQVFFGIPSGPLGYYLKKKYHVPFIIRFGGGDIPGFQDRFAFVYKAIAPFIRMIWKNADALVANSEGLRKLALDFYDKKEVLIIPNGADVRAFSGKVEEREVAGDRKVMCDDDDAATTGIQTVELDASMRNDTSSCRLLFVSRLIERKGLQDILPQLSEVVQHCADKSVQVTLDIVGDGPYRETLEKIVADHRISEVVRFHGQKSKEELPAYYADADVFLFPSRKEGMPNAVLEAMSYGLPIIMTPCQGSDELIDGNGYVTDAAGFGEKIEMLASDPSARKVMGQRSTELIEKTFSWRNTAEKYMELFDKVCRD